MVHGVYCRGLFYKVPKPLLTQAEVSNCMDCRSGFKRVNLCVREDLYRALVIFEASRGLKRYQVVNEALELYITYYDLIKRLGPDNLRRVLENAR